MSTALQKLLGSSIARKQVIALTGLAMVGFVVAHLTGNLLIFKGPEAFNGYAEKLHHLGPLLWVARIGLITAFVVHVWLTLALARENRERRPQGYDVNTVKGDRNFATTTMRYTGMLVALFLVLHLYDFTFGNKSGPQSVIVSVDPVESLGLFGLVWNSFNDWWRVPLYLLAVSGVGIHMSHAIESVVQTFGFFDERYTPVIRKISIGIGVVIALAFASIPIYIFLAPGPLGV